jgi:hypothetical protein
MGESPKPFGFPHWTRDEHLPQEAVPGPAHGPARSAARPQASLKRSPNPQRFFLQTFRVPVSIRGRIAGSFLMSPARLSVRAPVCLSLSGCAAQIVVVALILTALFVAFDTIQDRADHHDIP